MHRDAQEQSLIYLGGQSPADAEKWTPEHGSSQSYDTIHDGNGQTGYSAAPERDKHTTKQPYTSVMDATHPTTSYQTAGTLQLPKDRMLDT